MAAKKRKEGKTLIVKEAATWVADTEKAMIRIAKTVKRVRDKAAARVLKLAGLWAEEARTREVLSSRSYQLLKAVQKYERVK